MSSFLEHAAHLLTELRWWSIYGQISLLVVTLRLPIAYRLTKTLVTIDLNVKQYIMKNKQAWASAGKNPGGIEVQFWKVFLNDYRYILQRKKGLQESFNLPGGGGKQAPPPLGTPLQAGAELGQSQPKLDCILNLL